MSVEKQEINISSEVKQESALDRSVFVGRLWKASACGILGVVLGAGGETIRQTRINPVENQTRREMLKSLNLRNIIKAASIGGSAGFTAGFLSSRKNK